MHTRILGSILAFTLAACGGPVATGGNGTVPAPVSEPDPDPAVRALGAVLRLTYPDGGLCSAVAVLPTVALTAGHCIDQALLDGAVVTAPNGQRRGVLLGLADAPTHEGDDAADIAVLVLDAPVDVLAMVGPLPEPGALTTTAGYGCPPQGTLGARPAVFGRFRPDFGPAAFSFAGVVCGGDSGGAHFDGEGRLLGVNVARAASGDPRGIMVAAGAAVELLERLGL